MLPVLRYSFRVVDDDDDEDVATDNDVPEDVEDEEVETTCPDGNK